MDIHPTTDPATGPRWADQPRVLAELARIDLTRPDDHEGGEEPAAVRPTFVAFSGETPLFLATMRPFPSSGHHDPIIELGALAMALGADRLGVSLGGRAWSTRDPVPPVVPGLGDLRQRVLVIHVVDGTTSPTGTQTHLHPIVEDAPDPLGPSHVERSAAGWVVQAMQLMVEHPSSASGPAAELADQVQRCEQAGHVLAWGPDTLRRVRLALVEAGERT